MNGRQSTALIQGERILYSIRRSRRAKRLLLHVDEQGEIEVVVPWGVAFRQAEQFVTEKERWLHQHILAVRRQQRHHSQRVLTDGSQVPLFDLELLTVRVIREKRQRSLIARRGQTLEVRLNDQGTVSAAVERWYRRQARQWFTETATRLAAELGVTVEQVTIGNYKRQWGSCSAKGRLSFNWRLLLGPLDIARYVAVHEVAHIKYHNHSPAYWDVVSSLCPEYQSCRRWLRTNATQLSWS